MMKPTAIPPIAHYSCGPCAKRPGWSLAALANAMTGRSHRAAAPRAQLVEVCEHSRRALGIPATYKIAIIGGSDTGAFEGALWNLLGPRPVDVLAWDVFGLDWLDDITKQLKPLQVQTFTAPFGHLPDLTHINPVHDVVFTWNGTTSGVRVPHADWISDTHEGLVFCDAISAVFAMPIAWEKLDVITWSWQKALGGEAQHGMIALSPRAVERLNNHTPAWPVPKLFRLTKKGTMNDELFNGEIINTPSMLCVADMLDALRWADSIGGLPALIKRANTNTQIISEWIERTPWAGFLAAVPATRTTTSVCVTVAMPAGKPTDETTHRAFIKKICMLMEKEGAGFDINGHRDAPPGLRLWCGPTVEAEHLRLTLAWLDWAYDQVSKE